MSLVEKKISGETVFKGHLLDVRKDAVLLPNGVESKREYIVHQGAVVVLPITVDGKVIFVRQFRYPIGKEILELPAGKIDPNEPPFETAKRELLEEIGGSTEDWEHVGGMFPCVGYSNERIEMYVAKNVVLGPCAEIDEDEFIEIVEKTIPEALEMIATGELEDGKSILLLLKALSKV